MTWRVYPAVWKLTRLSAAARDVQGIKEALKMEVPKRYPLKGYMRFRCRISQN